MMGAIRDSVRDLAGSDDGEDGDVEEDDPVPGKLSKHDEPGLVIRTITKTGHQHMQRFRHKQMTIDQSMNPGLEDAADYFCESDKKYRIAKEMVPAVVPPHMCVDSVVPAQTACGELMECLQIVSGLWQMPQATS
jgi:hypothetical protein